MTCVMSGQRSRYARSWQVHYSFSIGFCKFFVHVACRLRLSATLILTKGRKEKTAQVMNLSLDFQRVSAAPQETSEGVSPLDRTGGALL
jgi:hypothetical protein